MIRTTAAIALFATLAAAPLGAQGRGRDKQNVPPGHRPPAGMCRIWIDGVPPGQQPAPTDCATAVRNRPSNGRVLFGDDAAKPGSSNKWRNSDKGKKHDRDDDDRRRRDRDDDDRWEDRRRSGDSSRRDDDRSRGPVELPRRDDDRNSSRLLPLMNSAVAYERGQRSNDVTRWLGSDRVDARITDSNRDGRPERVTWVEQSGRTRQIWIDSDRDGRADRVEMFENGRRVRTITD
jgi:hypothetical protein